MRWIPLWNALIQTWVRYNRDIIRKVQEYTEEHPEMSKKEGTIDGTWKNEK